MAKLRDAMEVLDHDFLETRCKILEIAAIMIGLAAPAAR